MRILTATLAAVALTVGMVAPAAAHPQVELQPPLGVDLTHTSTDNVGFVARFHEHFGAAGGILTSNEDAGEFFVVTDPRGVFTYDVANPEAPALLDVVLLDQGSGGDGPGTGFALAQEDPSTDGRILPVDGTDPTTGTQGMHVVDISDPNNIQVLGSMGTTDHTWTCVSHDGDGCAYAYGRDGHIVDIASDPTSPEIVADWRDIIGDSTYTHDFTEIREGLVMSAGSEPVLLDTTDPTNPIELTRVDLGDHGPDFPVQRSWPGLGYHSVEWAHGGADDFLIMGTEIAPDGALAGTDCEGENSVIETWDARPVRAALAEYDALVADDTTRTAAADAVFGADRDAVNFVRVDSFNAGGQGIFLDGQSAAHQLYCAHWMEKNPSWSDGGMLVVGYYDRGARFVKVHPFGATDADDNDIGGTLEEFGWFSGAETYAGSAQWITDEVVYVMDYRRGMDVIKLAPEAEATGTYRATGSVSDRAMTVAEMEGMGIAPPPAEDGVPYGPLTLAGVALAAAATLRRRHLATVEA